jgi:hypothetical protein
LPLAWARKKEKIASASCKPLQIKKILRDVKRSYKNEDNYVAWIAPPEDRALRQERSLTLEDRREPRLNRLKTHEVTNI